MAITYHSNPRGTPGQVVYLTGASGNTNGCVIPAVILADATGAPVAAGSATDPTTTQSAYLPAGTDRSATATTSSTQLAAANATRRGLEIQNIGANNVGINEFGGVAAIGTAGTYTIAPGGTLRVRTNRQVNMIAATAATALSATEW